MATDRTPAVLIKAPPLKTVNLGVGVTTLRLSTEPLFDHIEADRGGAFAAAGDRATWQRVALEAGDERNLWDLCHDLTGEGSSLGAAGGGVVFAEPDLWQQWNHPMPRVDFGLAANCPTTAEPQRTNFPRIPGDNFWFRDTGHSGFAAISGGAGAGARVAHIDTGYDPGHATLPKHLRGDLQRNFVEPDRPNDATDRAEGLWVQDGHGTGTIALLAGGMYGGAPGAEVVPIRIADRVVLFRSSAFAKALDYVYGLRSDPATRIDVVTMSMGGVASQAWAEAVNRLYEAGVFIVTAAGNNQGNLPTRNIVFPARFRRVIAACGVMADGSPYADLGFDRMAGNYGPDSKMATALSASTPNLPWAVGGCGQLVNWSGQGTSCATPQIAAAAALWIARHRAKLDAYPQGWMKVEAVRRALYDSAEAGDRVKLGRGRLQSDIALQHAPVASEQLKQEDSASAEFPLLRLFTGLGVSPPDPARLRMLELEALQLSQSKAVEDLLPDPERPPGSLTPEARRAIAEALADQPGASTTLKQFLLDADSRSVSPPARSSAKGDKAVVAPELLEMAQVHLRRAVDPPVSQPAIRRLRVYAFDPSLDLAQETAAINVAKLDIPWEPELQPGPVGEYLEVVDIDPASAAAYAPVDLNHPYLLSQDGLAPTPSDPRFHQQMVYAVAMKTIGHFERALGRTALWATHQPETQSEHRSEQFVQRLRVYPHAFRGPNAYYSPERKALLFGYFPAGGDWRDTPEGQLTFSCLSHDIVAHETSHALLDGLHPRYRESSHPDSMALHEAFADIVALFQHFTLPEVLEQQIAKSRGDLFNAGLLRLLAIEFGRATSRPGQLQQALRDGGDELSRENLSTLQGVGPDLPDEAHDRGARLVAAVFDAFLTLYAARQEEVVALATGGSGVMPEGRMPQPLVKALAKEAATLASQLLTICIRALDYCPPVDVTFGDYLRALITADRDVVPNDPRGYRLALIGGFTKRGIFPPNVPHLSPGSVVWEAPPTPIKTVSALLPSMDLGWNRSGAREKAWETSRENARVLHGWLTGKTWKDGKQVPVEVKATDTELQALGLFRDPGKREIHWEEDGEQRSETVEIKRIEVHSVRPARRVSPDGQSRSDLVVEITQAWIDGIGIRRRGGCTVLFDLETFEARYLIRKRVGNIALARSMPASPEPGGPGGNYFATQDEREPFALLHRCH
ncbi:S8 family serine peptidase [Caulobacter mirabilis]|uniref:Peptidase S8 n=1 Tax=Caulobacter mirabilis TaxID=69666 RepID=A0A2D2AY10_9CAUL|nr:S8 family serine peptidase [Caulobacter mirabilis]ATQ42909.1 peptidase S8 [Caulobacter mirabilis]